MTNLNTPADQTIYGAFGEFIPDADVDSWTDEQWNEYDRWIAEDIAAADEQREADADFYFDLDSWGDDR